MNKLSESIWYERLYERVNTEAAAHHCSLAVLKNKKQPLADVPQNKYSKIS